MYKKVLVAYDGSEGAKPAFYRAVTLANIYGASLTMVWVRTPMPHHAWNLNPEQEERSAAEEYFEGLKDEVMPIAKEQGIELDCVSLYGDIASSVVQFAERKHIELIVVGQAGHSDIISRMLGQVADRISETAKCDVLIVRKPNP